jgi:hypothetical protein
MRRDTAPGKNACTPSGYALQVLRRLPEVRDDLFEVLSDLVHAGGRAGWDGESTGSSLSVG